MYQSESERSACNLLGTLTLSKYTYKQTKLLEQIQRTTIHSNPSQNKASIKFYELTFLQNFGNDALITNFQITLNDHKLWNMIFQFNNVEASYMNNRSNYTTMSNIKTQQTEKENVIMIDAYAFTQSIKFIINLKKDFHLYCDDAINLKREKTKSNQEENITRIISHAVSSIKIYGFNLHTSPPATQLTKLLNISQCFKKNKRYQQEAESDILLALCLINARRFIQASELLRKTSNFYVKKYINSKSHLQSSKYQRSWMKQYEQINFQQSLNMSRNYSTGRVLQGAKHLFKAAKIELLLAETISHPSLRYQKLQAYNRSNSYFNGNPNPTALQPNVDIQEILFKIGPNLIVFLMKVLYDRAEILRITALKSIQFIFQTVGCSLSQMIQQLLKTILITYPPNHPSQSFQSLNQISQKQKQSFQKQSQKVSNEISSSKNKILIDGYHHLLQTFIGLLPLMNKKYLRSIFKDILVPNIENSINATIKNQLKLYLLRFSQKILSICLSDLDIPTNFIASIITMSQKKIHSSNNCSKYTVHNLSFFSQRIIQLIKIKILPKYNSSENIISLCGWINENLVYFCQNQITQENMQFFSLLIDFLAIIFARPVSKKLPYPIQPILYFLNMSINQQFLPFDNLLNVTIILLKYIKLKNSSLQICNQIVGRIMNKATISTLNIKQLKILQSVLKTFDSCQISWLIQFLNCIPHSTFDEIYSVFSILVEKCLQNITKQILQKIINTLLDQYTVKGKAHQFSRNYMIELIKNKKPALIKSIFQICLTQNPQPLFTKYQSRKKRTNEHNIDSKMYKVHYQLFVQKLDFFLLFLNKHQDKSSLISKLFTLQFIKTIYFILKNLLQSKSSKIKQKSLRIIKNLNQIIADNISPIKKIDLFYCKAIISLLKTFIIQQPQSKLQYQVVTNIDLIFNSILKCQQKTTQSTTQESQLDFMDGNIQTNTNFQIPFQNLDSKMSQIRFREFVKIYHVLINLLNSPWENIRQIIIQTIIQFFSKGLSIYPENYQRKAIQVLKPLILNFISSSDYSQRFGGCKIIGCLLGLSRDFKSRQQMVEFFSRYSKNIKGFSTQIFNLQQDWHQGTSKISKLILQVSLSLDQQQTLKKKIQNWKKTQQMMQSSYCTFNLNEQFNNYQNKFQKNSSSFSVSNFQNLQTLLKQNSRFQEQNKNQSRYQETIQIDDKLQQQIGYFKAQIQKNHNLKTSFFGDKESFLIQREEDHYFQPNQDKAESLNQQNKDGKNEEEPLEFEDLGIIDLDDQEWGQQQNEVKITQKLPLKKIYKLSPNVGSSNKHQRIRSKRYFSNQFDYNDKIIVDQLQGRINHDTRQKLQKPKVQEKLQRSAVTQQQQRYQKPSTTNSYINNVHINNKNSQFKKPYQIQNPHNQNHSHPQQHKIIQKDIQDYQKSQQQQQIYNQFQQSSKQFNLKVQSKQFINKESENKQKQKKYYQESINNDSNNNRYNEKFNNGGSKVYTNGQRISINNGRYENNGNKYQEMKYEEPKYEERQRYSVPQRTLLSTATKKSKKNVKKRKSSVLK